MLICAKCKNGIIHNNKPVHWGVCAQCSASGEELTEKEKEKIEKSKSSY